MEQFSANIVLYLRQEIQARTAYKRQLEERVKPPTYDLVGTKHYLADRERLQENIKNLTKEIIEITRKHLQTVEIDPNSDEITIANILASLPPPEKVVTQKIFHAQQ